MKTTDMSKDAMKLALEALGQLWLFSDEAAVIANPAITALRKALAEQPVAATQLREQEPAAKYIGEGSEGSLVQLYDDVKKGADLYTAPQPAQQEPVLQDIEQYRLQMAGICTAALGYWKEDDGIHPDYDTWAFRDVAKLYAKYDELYRAQPAQRKPLTAKQSESVFAKADKLMEADDNLSWRSAILKAVEAAHDIKENT